MKRMVMLVGGVLVALFLSMASPAASAHRPGVGISVQVQPAPRHCWRLRSCHGWRVRAAWRQMARADRRALYAAATRTPRSTAEQDALALERLYRRQGKTEAAVQMYQDILRDGRDATLIRLAHRRLALWAIKNDQPAEAEAHLRANLNASMAD